MHVTIACSRDRGYSVAAIGQMADLESQSGKGFSQSNMQWGIIK